MVSMEEWRGHPSTPKSAGYKDPRIYPSMKYPTGLLNNLIFLSTANLAGSMYQRTYGTRRWQIRLVWWINGFTRQRQIRPVQRIQDISVIAKSRFITGSMDTRSGESLAGYEDPRFYPSTANRVGLMDELILPVKSKSSLCKGSRTYARSPNPVSMKYWRIYPARENLAN